MFRELFQKSGLSLDRLHTFCIVAEDGGVTRAAKGDPTTQSLYSRQIKELEEYFQIELIHRSGRGVVLTEFGKQLAVLVREHFTALNDFRATCAKLPLKITVASGDSLMRWLILRRFEEFQKDLPGISFVFLNLKSGEIEGRLLESTVDFGILRDNEFTPPIKSVPLGILSFSVFVPKEKTVEKNLKQTLNKVSVASLEGSGSFNREVASEFKQRGIRLDTQVECSSFPLIAQTVISQKLAAILPAIAKHEFDTNAVTEVKAPLLKKFDRRIVLAWNTRLLRIRPLLNKVRAILQDELKF